MESPNTYIALNGDPNTTLYDAHCRIKNTVVIHSRRLHIMTIIAQPSNFSFCWLLDRNEKIYKNQRWLALDGGMERWGLRQFEVGGGRESLLWGLCKQKPLNTTFTYALFPYFQDFFLTPDTFLPCKWSFFALLGLFSVLNFVWMLQTNNKLIGTCKGSPFKVTNN